MKKSLIVCCIFMISKLAANDYYVNAKSGLIVREKPSAKAPRLGHLKYLTKFEVLKTGQIETIGNHEGAWLQIEFKGKNVWVFGGFASNIRPNVTGKALPLATFLDANIEIQLEVSKAVKGENPHGFAFIQKRIGPLDAPAKFTCELPMSGGSDGYECIEVAKVSASHDLIEFNLVGKKCIEVPQDPTEFCQKHSEPIRVLCTVDRNTVEASYSETGKIQGKISNCKNR